MQRGPVIRVGIFDASHADIFEGYGERMRLRTRLVVAATLATFAIVVSLSVVFLGELLRQRIEQTAASNDVMARQLLMMTRQAVEVELPQHPPVDASEESFNAAVADALRSDRPLLSTMNAFVLYSPSVQDASVTDAHELTLVSTDPTMLNQPRAERMRFSRLEEEGVVAEARKLMGQPSVLDVSMPLQRNGRPFLTVHLGIRSTFLKNNYVPWLTAGLLLAVLGGVLAMLTAGALASIAVRPIEEISRRLELLAGNDAEQPALAMGSPDALVRVTRSIERLGEQIETKEAGYTSLQANLTQMLDTLRDGVLLFTGEDRAAMVSDAVEHFVATEGGSLVGKTLKEIFRPETALGQAVLEAYALEENVAGELVELEDGREVEISVDHIDNGRRPQGAGRDAGDAPRCGVGAAFAE